MGKTKQVRQLKPTFVAVPPSGTSTETRLWVTDAEDALLWALYEFGGRLRNRDLRFLTELKVLDNGDKKERKHVLAARRRNLTGEYSGRFASAVCQANVDEWQLGKRNLVAYRKSLRVRIKEIERRLKIGAGNETEDGAKGYPSKRAARLKSNKRNQLKQKLEKVNTKLAEKRVSVCRGGAALARKRHNLEDAGLTVEEWEHEWRVARGWFAAIGSSGERFGNDTLHVDPYSGDVEIMLPPDKAALSNTPGRRRTIRLEAPVEFNHLHTEWAVRAETSRPLRYEISYKHPVRNKEGGWYLKASWSTPTTLIPTLETLRERRTLGVDFNADHFACYVIEPDGNPVGDPITIPLETADLSTTKTEAYICDIVLLLVEQAHKHGCRSIAVENLGFADTRNKGKEWQASSKQFRKTVHGMPTAKFRDRLVSMLHNLDDALWVTAVDPAYTSVLGKSHWLELLQESYNRDCTGHHAAAVVIGRRGMGFTARRRLNIHESEQKSRRECFFRRSIRSCGADETSGAGTGDQMNGTSKPMTHQGSAEPQRLHSAQRPRPMNVTENPGEDKQFDLAAMSQTRDKHPCLTELFVCPLTRISACWSRWLRLCWV